MNEKAQPEQAAAVILLRRAAPSGFEVFLTRRPESMPFLGGMYCYPGGTVRKDDCAPAMLAHCFGLAPRQAQAIIGAHFSPRAALGLWVTAAREVFEEVGILFAVNDSGEPYSMSDPKSAHRFAEKRRQMLAQSVSFLALLESEGLRCDLSALTHFSYWQTPAQISMRFDTRFFIAVLPEEQTPLATSDEVTHSLWLTPDHAMRMFQGGNLPMIFPTFTALRTLADFETLESVFKEFRPTHSTAL